MRIEVTALNSVVRNAVHAKGQTKEHHILRVFDLSVLSLCVTSHCFSTMRIALTNTALASV